MKTDGFCSSNFMVCFMINKENEIDVLKAGLRRELLEKRRSFQCSMSDAGALKTRVLLSLPLDLSLYCVSGYSPVSGEMLIMELLLALEKRGAVLSLPVINSKASCMVFKKWHSYEPLRSGPHNVLQPHKDSEVVHPDIILSPLVAFDQYGNRLGMGGGFYDKYICKEREKRKILVYGIGYDFQEVKQVPCAFHDQRVDGVFTPTRFIVAGSALETAL
jgi:5-formyltetrahydrofolate cyclo-ligase